MNRRWLAAMMSVCMLAGAQLAAANDLEPDPASLLTRVGDSIDPHLTVDADVPPLAQQLVQDLRFAARATAEAAALAEQGGHRHLALSRALVDEVVRVLQATQDARGALEESLRPSEGAPAGGEEPFDPVFDAVAEAIDTLEFISGEDLGALRGVASELDQAADLADVEVRALAVQAMRASPLVVWTNWNMGHASGLDADTLDGYHVGTLFDRIDVVEVGSISRDGDLRIELGTGLGTLRLELIDLLSKVRIDAFAMLDELWDQIWQILDLLADPCSGLGICLDPLVDRIDGLTATDAILDGRIDGVKTLLRTRPCEEFGICVTSSVDTVKGLLNAETAARILGDQTLTTRLNGVDGVTSGLRTDVNRLLPVLTSPCSISGADLCLTPLRSRLSALEVADGVIGARITTVDTNLRTLVGNVEAGLQADMSDLDADLRSHVAIEDGKLRDLITGEAVDREFADDALRDSIDDLFGIISLLVVTSDVEVASGTSLAGSVEALGGAINEVVQENEALTQENQELRDRIAALEAAVFG